MPAAAMVERAAAFLASLDAPTRALAQLPFADEVARRDWHYIPRRRAGASFVQLDAATQKRAYDLLATGLSLPAYAAATTIIALEDVLDEVEGKARHRHRADYSTTIFGDPSAAAPWGWRFEGHHVSVNATIVDGAVSAMPQFLGANPAAITAGEHGPIVTRPLAAEEELAFALIAALSPSHRAETIVANDAPDDLLTTAAPRLAEVIPPEAGVRLGVLPASGEAAGAAERLIEHYLNRLPPPLAERRRAAVASTMGDVHFAFAGLAAQRQRHYYRIQGPGLFVEYDCTQDGANHIHSVLRDPADDFGDDLLASHYLVHPHD